MRYKFFVTDNKVVCVSTYAGKSVRGIAKCDPKDTFNLEGGKGLAQARVDYKIAEKRLKRALLKSAEATLTVEKARAYQARMRDYALESQQELEQAKANLAKLEASM